jgi:hypothetical protein
MTRTAVSAGIFVVLAVLAAVLDRRAAARASAALTAAMRTTPGRITVLAVWIWLGIHFLAR